jgi:nicotinate-nucleotide pyrophosphorylase (carboxylating)
MSNPNEAPLHVVREAVARALAEDLTPLGDLSAGLVPAHHLATAAFVPRQDGVLAGRQCAEEAFRQVDPSLEVRWTAADGDALAARQPFGTVTGPLAPILTAERTALNFVGHLSGIATAVRSYVDAAAAQGSARVWDTRKTVPGLRSLQKAAVRAGGGANHRGNLSEWIMLKDNHLTGTSITAAVELARQRWPGRTVHVEAERMDQVEEAVLAGADAILLDNMSPAEVAAAVRRTQELCGDGRRPLLEASGGISLETVGAYSAAGVDLISIGRLTNSVSVLDIGLDVVVAP